MRSFQLGSYYTKIKNINPIARVVQIRLSLWILLSLLCNSLSNLVCILSCSAMTALSTLRNSRHKAKFSLASAPLIRYKLLAATVEESMHCDEALCGSARSITSKSEVNRVISLINNGLGVVEFLILEFDFVQGVQLFLNNAYSGAMSHFLLSWHSKL